MKKTEEYVDQICSFLNFNKEDFEKTLNILRAKGWERWGGGTVEVTVAEILYVVTTLKKPQRVLEAGTSWGYSGAHIAEALRDIGKENYFLSLDISEPDLNEARKFLTEKKLLGNIDIKCQSSEIAIDLKSLDMIFVDSSHRYEGTKSEWKWMYPLLFKNKGIALFHDAYTDDYGVKKFLLELEKKGHKLIILDTQDCTGLGIVTLADTFIEPRTIEEVEVDEWLDE